MGKGQAGLARWALRKADQYLEASRNNLEHNLTYPAAEEVFRAAETSLEAMLYARGITKIEYPGNRGKFTGRLALQFLIRDNLVQTGVIPNETYEKYMEMADQIHRAGYQPHIEFDKETVLKHAKLAEQLFVQARSMAEKL